jgi:AcrR family transcriptional regulator
MTTKDRILDTAERLFGRDGFEATSLRAITSEADVNLAAVNYHFQSKDALVQEVIRRRMGPVSERRLVLLDAFEAEAGGDPVPLEKLLEAFLRPVVEIVGGHAKDFAPLIGRVYTEPTGFTERLFQQQFEPLARRFIPAFERALPDMPRTELLWRLHFSIGVLAHTLAAASLLRIMSGGLCDPSDVDGTLCRITAFTLAGLTAPVPVEVHHANH